MAIREISVVTLGIRCVGESVVDVDIDDTGEAVMFIALSGLWPDIIRESDIFAAPILAFRVQV